MTKNLTAIIMFLILGLWTVYVIKHLGGEVNYSRFLSQDVSYDFDADEFNDKPYLGAFCKAIMDDGNGKYFNNSPNPIDGLNELLRIPDLYNTLVQKKSSYAFTIEEFKGLREIRSLFKLITEDLYGISYEPGVGNPVDKLNVILSSPYLYDTWNKKNNSAVMEIISGNSQIKALIDITRVYRDISFDQLPQGMKNNIFRLNRLLIEGIYPKQCPKVDEKLKRVVGLQQDRDIQQLVEQTAPYRIADKAYFLLSQKEQKSIVKLNRLLLESMYKEYCPRNRQHAGNEQSLMCLQRAIYFDGANAEYHARHAHIMAIMFQEKQKSSREPQTGKETPLPHPSPEKVITSYKASISSNPVNSVYHTSLAWFYGYLAQLKILNPLQDLSLRYRDLAEKEFKTGIALAPAKPSTHQAYGMWAFKMAEAVASNPSAADASHKSLQYFVSMGKREYRSAIELDYKLTREALAFYSNHVSTTEEIKAIVPDNPEAQLEMARYLRDK